MPFTGSSPPAWGTRLTDSWGSVAHGLIPTCVGNTSTGQYGKHHQKAHPHLRGEHQMPDRSTHDMLGSSPPAWGTRLNGGVDAHGRGLIPTCVGNTQRGGSAQLRHRAHPHLRGEHVTTRSPCAWKLGSSPPAWGTHQRFPDAPVACGLIPTCVGNTVFSGQGLGVDGAHPHLRGEHVSTAATTNTRPGSSPPAWGTRSVLPCCSCARGLIPTCVGNTRGRQRHMMHERAHPHLRGEHASCCQRITRL